MRREPEEKGNASSPMSHIEGLKNSQPPEILSRNQIIFKQRFTLKEIDW